MCFLLVCFIAVQVEVHGLKRKHRFELHVHAWLEMDHPQSTLLSVIGRKWPNVSVPLIIHRQLCSKQSLEHGIATDILSRRFFFIIVQKLLKQLARMQSSQE